MNYAIEPMRIDDFEEVASLWRASEGVGLSRADGQAGIKVFLERNPNLSLVVRSGNGKILGAVLCGHDGRRGFLYHLAVARECRSQGIGRCLVKECLARLGALGLEKCNIFVYANNAEGKAFWRRQGWQERADLGVLQMTLDESKA